ncbi:MAG: hypothetical protein HQK56_18925 [Deltaproteobacteria bacterium]|nr:hypothetical protein [Deltaproteobacteria bacterium]
MSSKKKTKKDKKNSEHTNRRIVPSGEQVEIDQDLTEVKAGLDRGDSSESLAAMVVSRAAFSKQLAGAVIHGLAGLPHPGVPPLLAELKSRLPDPRIQKEIRRTIHFLRRRGLEFDEAIFRDEPRKILSPPNPERIYGYIGTIPEHGVLQLVIAREPALTPPELHHVMINRFFNFLSMQSVYTSKKKIQVFLSEQFRIQSPETNSAELELDAALYILEDAAPLVEQLDKEERSKYRSLTAWLRKAATPLERPPIYKHLEIPASDALSLVETLDELIETPEFFLVAAGLKTAPLADKVEELSHSPLHLSPEIEKERLEDLVAEDTADIFNPGLISVLRAYLETLAYYLFRLGRRKEAARVLALAMGLDESDNDSPLAVATRRNLVTASLNLQLEMRQEDRGSDLDLLDDDEDEEDEITETRTESGLILPFAPSEEPDELDDPDNRTESGLILPYSTRE